MYSSSDNKMYALHVQSGNVRAIADAMNGAWSDQTDSGINSETLGIGSGFPSAMALARK